MTQLYAGIRIEDFTEYENKATVNGKRSIDTPRKINRWGSFRINFIKGRTKKDTQNDQGVEKVKNCLHVKPCVIDYGVNFGLKSVETLWRQNLMRNDNSFANGPRST